MLAVEAVPVLLHAPRARSKPKRQAPTGELVEIPGLGGEHHRGAAEGVGDRAAELDLVRRLCHGRERDGGGAVVELGGPDRLEASLLRQPGGLGEILRATRAGDE